MYDERVDLQDDRVEAPRVVGAFRVSGRGQLSLPAEIRRRWGIEAGGPVEIVDLGDAVLLVPGEDGTFRRRMLEHLTPEAYQGLVDGIDDPDLRTW
jgi:AbrB family looped-hinge helix DNA binding protein